MKIALQAYVQNSAAAVAFYQRAFGAALGYHVRNEDGTFMHAELYLEGQLLLSVSEAIGGAGLEAMRGFAPTNYPVMNFCVNLGSEEKVKQVYDVLTEDANILLPFGPLPWSKACANVIDRFGIFWYISV